ncbi:class IV adenylate cyclase [Schlesneria paludicola]|uniref:class IV adenylate cyclase n=1 Tax=Schlesneria paludicola TaxID=360056 RepID=UPI00029A13E1|nr:class IV adenylate cyclase [Schlesneria paludicola]
MKYEVELKFRLERAQDVEAAVLALGACEHAPVSHCDRYFNHPSRDFRTTDEAFRIRSVDGSNAVTYKGPKIGTVAKTRHEIEVGFDHGPDSLQKLDEIVRMLGFRFVREVRKSRRTFTLDVSGRDFELALDDVPGLGPFLEIELIAEADGRDAAEKAVWELAGKLGLSVPETRSYLDLLIESDGLVS